MINHITRIAAALAIAAGLAGCATAPPLIWEKEGTTEEQFRRDSVTCKQVGMQSAQVNGLTGNVFVGSWIRDETIRCMRELGYRQVQQ